MEFPKGIYPTALSVISLCTFALSSFAATNVTIAPAGSAVENRQNAADKPAWHRKLWEGKFDAASDQTGAAARQLEGGLNFNCEQYQEATEAKPGKPGKPADMAAYASCMQRNDASQGFAKQARSIQGQQKIFSVISKTADVAAVGAIGATIYSELGVKKNTPQDPGGQIESYEKAARIQRKAGQVSYITGATDFTLGAYAYIAHKNKLEKMQQTISGTVGGQRATTDNAALNSSLANAVEASKKAAYSHMMYGAGKVAVGYASMYLAKRTEEQADKMVSIEEDKAYQAMLAQKQAAAGTLPVDPYAAAYKAGVTMGTPPYYNNNNPVFTMPNGQSANTNSTGNGVVSYSVPGGGSGSSSSGASVAPRGGLRGLASKGSELSASGGAAPAKDSDSPSEASAENSDANKEKASKDALTNFDLTLTGGHKSYSGSGTHTADGKDDAAALAAGLLGASTDSKSAATGLSPTQMYNAATEGTEGREEGSMSGVSAKGETTLFAIMKDKLTKMFQVGNVGIPKTVEVKN